MCDPKRSHKEDVSVGHAEGQWRMGSEKQQEKEERRKKMRDER